MTGSFMKLGKVVPVAAVNSAEVAPMLGVAILQGGLSSLEVTLRTECALKVIETLAEQLPELTVGAGTVLNAGQARDAVSAGARFIVSPGLSCQAAEWCLERDVPFFPGVMTPTEIMAALELGITEMKFFPAELAGGIPMLKGLAGPFSQVRFMPTGGVGPRNLRDYLALPNVMACGGTWLCSRQLLERKEYDEIRLLCRQAARLSETE